MQPTGILPSSALLLALAAMSALPAMAQQDQPVSNLVIPPRPRPASNRPGGQSRTTATAQPATTTTADDGTRSGAAATDRPTDLPTLTRPAAIPTYPAPAVPPTQDAPFMQHSNLPDGTVFIAVGAILGAFGLAILLWRAIVSLLLHRSVKRAAMAQHTTSGKAGFPAPPAPFYKYTDQDSTMSLPPGAGPATGRGVRRTARAPVHSATPSHSNLFFSPTAVNQAGSRASIYLPSGYYASGTGSPVGNPNNTIGLNSLRPDSRGHYTDMSRNTLSGSPPDSPQYAMPRDVNTSSSSLHLQTPAAGQRAPSAYLDDLLADDPGFLPPPQMGPLVGSSMASPGSTANNSIHNRL